MWAIFIEKREKQLLAFLQIGAFKWYSFGTNHPPLPTPK